MSEQITIDALKTIVGPSDPTQRDWGQEPSEPQRGWGWGQRPSDSLLREAGDSDMVLPTQRRVDCRVWFFHISRDLE